MIHVLATVTLAPGTRAQFLDVFNANVPAVHAEDGCIEYGAAIDAPTDVAVQAPVRPDVVVVVEKWRDVAALKAHSAAPHMAVYRAKANGWIWSVTWQILDPAWRGSSGACAPDDGVTSPGSTSGTGRRSRRGASRSSRCLRPWP